MRNFEVRQTQKTRIQLDARINFDSKSWRWSSKSESQLLKRNSWSRSRTPSCELTTKSCQSSPKQRTFKPQVHKNDMDLERKWTIASLKVSTLPEAESSQSSPKSKKAKNENETERGMRIVFCLLSCMFYLFQFSSSFVASIFIWSLLLYFHHYLCSSSSNT